MAMAGRHIRHDWQTFVEWDQKSVRTVCGKTSTFNATGIPGVSDQPDIVEANGKKVFGWCTSCAVEAYKMYVAVDIGSRFSDIHPYIRPMYDDVGRIVKPIYEAWASRQRAARRV